ncbi:MAG TPA: LLM class flavin-dependent oxidoreductase [Alphaproteobacteria bacterium]|jgi:alkanesulfonate monooxygenase SsuD/methylene tetrahydromethanopterin reductase-like flavin-dependent oxidoreductase (luciferase family)
MIKPWIFEFFFAPGEHGRPQEVSPETATAHFQKYLSLWERAEPLGFEGIFFSEHHFGRGYSPSPNLIIAHMATRTKRLRLGTLGMVLPYYDPWRVVEEIGMLDHLTGGRLEIGTAAGIPNELRLVGLSYEEARRRFDEALEVLDAALKSPVVSHHGRFWKFDNLRIVPRPLQQPAPPKWTTVLSTASARKSARRGSKICTSFQSRERVKDIFDAYRDEADRLGAPAGPEQLAIRRIVSIAESEAAAQAATRAAIEQMKTGVAIDPRAAMKTALLDVPNPAAGFIVDDDEFITGTPSQVVEQIVAQCRFVGAGHFVAMMSSRDGLERAWELFGEQVNPKLRKAALGQAAAPVSAHS